MEYGLEGKVALITGAGGSIGRGIARGFAGEKAKVFVTDLEEKPLGELKNEIEAAGGAAAHLKADVTKIDEVQRVVEEALEVFSRIDILVNVAGIVAQGPIEETGEKLWDSVFEVNCKGTFLFIREVVPVMKRQKSGRIINFSSKSGKTGSALLSAYSASKAAVIGLTQALAYELADHGIRVNCVCPGLVEDTGVWSALAADYGRNMKLTKEGVAASFTQKIPLKRLASVDDISAAVLFLASKGSDYMTGQAINLTGGREMH